MFSIQSLYEWYLLVFNTHFPDIKVLWYKVSVTHPSFCSISEYTISGYITASFRSCYRCILTIALVQKKTLLQMTGSLRCSLLNSYIYTWTPQSSISLVIRTVYITRSWFHTVPVGDLWNSINDPKSSPSHDVYVSDLNQPLSFNLVWIVSVTLHVSVVSGGRIVLPTVNQSTLLLTSGLHHSTNIHAYIKYMNALKFPLIRQICGEAKVCPLWPTFNVNTKF